jgi:Polyketide cyclase / dehydrase and lipid transport
MTFGFRVERATSAPPERLYGVLADVVAFREWAPLFRYSEIIRPGTPDPLGAGAVRRLGPVKWATVDEEIVEARPPHYQRYIGVRGFPVAQYRGEIRLSQLETGTQLLWTVTFEQKVPGTGRPLTTAFRAVITYLVNHAIRVAEESA